MSDTDIVENFIIARMTTEDANGPDEANPLVALARMEQEVASLRQQFVDDGVELHRKGQPSYGDLRNEVERLRAEVARAKLESEAFAEVKRAEVERLRKAASDEADKTAAIIREKWEVEAEVERLRKERNTWRVLAEDSYSYETHQAALAEVERLRNERDSVIRAIGAIIDRVRGQ